MMIFIGLSVLHARDMVFFYLLRDALTLVRIVGGRDEF